jgi:sterol desaturase/sphingolipid hydroxylase (fatty acid hydroxylase superfamily)
MPTMAHRFRALSLGRKFGKENMLQVWIIAVAALVFFVLERVLPGRELPEPPGWYMRAAFLNGCQIGIVLLAGVAWNRWLQSWSLFRLSRSIPAVFQGLICWFVGTFVFYWWHRARHDVNFLWRVFHQVHHSPSRIELLTAFYKHPLEIAADSLIASTMLFSVFGVSIQAAAWYNVFAALGEYFYHSNLRTPVWFGYFIQRPEHHSIHHELDVHRFNYGDITWWDRLFGTFREAVDFAPKCGFPEDHETNLARMLLFHDNY